MSEQGRIFAVGLTGGIGSGKSTVTGMFASLGVAVLDLDRLGHEVMRDDPSIRSQLIEAFGEEIIGEGGEIDRKRLAERAFATDAGTEKLNGIVHPAIWDREAHWLAMQQAPYVIIEASVLIESRGYVRMDSVVVVRADEAVRKARVLERGGMSGEMFDAIVSRQCSDEERLAHADYVIDNSGCLAELQGRVKALHTELLRQFGS